MVHPRGGLNALRKGDASPSTETDMEIPDPETAMDWGLDAIPGGHAFSRYAR